MRGGYEHVRAAKFDYGAGGGGAGGMIDAVIASKDARRGMYVVTTLGRSNVSGSGEITNSNIGSTGARGAGRSYLFLNIAETAKGGGQIDTGSYGDSGSPSLQVGQIVCGFLNGTSDGTIGTEGQPILVGTAYSYPESVIDVTCDNPTASGSPTTLPTFTYSGTAPDGTAITTQAPIFGYQTTVGKYSPGDKARIRFKSTGWVILFANAQFIASGSTFWGKINSGSGPYSFTEYVPNGSGGFSLLSGGRTGSAYESNGVSVPAGKYVLIEQTDVGGTLEYAFSYGSSSSSGSGFWAEITAVTWDGTNHVWSHTFAERSPLSDGTWAAVGGGHSGTADDANNYKSLVNTIVWIDATDIGGGSFLYRFDHTDEATFWAKISSPTLTGSQWSYSFTGQETIGDGTFTDATDPITGTAYEANNQPVPTDTYVLMRRTHNTDGTENYYFEYTKPQSFWAKLTAPTLTSGKWSFSFTEQTVGATGAFSAMSGGRTGTAYEANNGWVPANTYARVFVDFDPGDGTARYTFQFEQPTTGFVSVTQSGGSAGDLTTSCSFTYNWTDAFGNSHTAESPVWARPSPGKLVAATHGSVRLNGTTWVLMQVDEVPSRGGC